MIAKSSGTRRVTSATMLVVVVLALVGVAFTTGVLAADINTTDRTVTNTTVAPGENVTVEVVVDTSGTLGSTELVEVTDNFSSSFANVEFNESDPQVGGAGSNQDNTEFIAVWNEDADFHNVSYDVMIPTDANGGKAFTITGTVEVSGNSQSLPTTTLTVEGADTCTYTSDDGTVENDGLRDAVDDWRTGSIATGLLRDVVDVWRSGTPVSGC